MGSFPTSSDAVQTLTFKSGTTTRLTTTRSHDSSDRLDGVTHDFGTSQTQTFGVSEFDAMNRRKKIIREDGTRWAFGYNAKGEVTSGIRENIASPNTPVPGWSHAYNFDEIGNRNSATTNGRVSNYTPNALNQYEDRSIPRAFDVIGKANTAASVTVDANPATRLDEFFFKEITVGSGAVHIPYAVTATDANGTTTRDGGKFLAADPEDFIHDDDGNLTSDGRFTLTWDAENRLIGMETHATVPLPARRKLAFFYDAMGRRISKTVWHGTSGGGWQLHHKFDFIHELGGWNILAERSGGSSNSFLRTYTWGSDLSGTHSGAGGVGGLLFTTLHTSGKTFAYGMDLTGNVTLLVNIATGQAAATYDYGPFGEPLRQSGEYATLNPFRFSTKYTDDETGMVDYGLRYYIPSTGCWPSRDPIAERGGVNLYGFVGNDGANRVDILGMAPDDKVKKIILIAGPDYKTANGIARRELAKTLGVPEETPLYNGNHPLGISKELMERNIQIALDEWEKSAKRKCCFKFQAGKIESSQKAPMTIELAKSLVEKYSKEGLTIVTAHGIRDALPGNETGLVFYKGIDKSNGFNWGIAYPVSALTTDEMSELPVLACNDAGLPNAVGKTKIIKVGGNQFGDNTGSEVTSFIKEYVKKQCDACK